MSGPLLCIGWLGCWGNLRIDLGWPASFSKETGDQCAWGPVLAVAGPTGWPQSHAGQMFQTELDPAASSFLPWKVENKPSFSHPGQLGFPEVGGGTPSLSWPSPGRSAGLIWGLENGDGSVIIHPGPRAHRCMVPGLPGSTHTHMHGHTLTHLHSQPQCNSHTFPATSTLAHTHMRAVCLQSLSLLPESCARRTHPVAHTLKCKPTESPAHT